MSEPTAGEVREMAEWAGWKKLPRPEGKPVIWQSPDGLCEVADVFFPAWNDGRLLWAMHCKLREGGTAEITYAAAGGGLLYGEGYTGQWYRGENDAERLWAACREVTK